MTDLFIVDAHQDLAWNMFTFGRDYTLSAADTRKREEGTLTPQMNGDSLLGWPDYQNGKVGVVFSTLYAAPARLKLGEWDQQCYATDKEAHMLYSRQLDAYIRLADEHPAMFQLIKKKLDLQSILAHWKRNDVQEHPVGLVILMEAAEGVREPAELEEWYQRGVRIIGPAWAGTRFCGGTHEPGPLTKDGFELLDRMAEFRFTLDLSHMDEKAALQALDIYSGPVIASHANAMELLKESSSNRHLTNREIQGLLERGGTIGIVPANGFLKPNWNETGGRASVTLDYVTAQIDYICQMAGNALHVGIGSDFDGGFGLQSVPSEINSVADLRKIIPLLSQKGYTESDISAIMGGNWITHLQNTLPEAL